MQVGSKGQGDHVAHQDRLGKKFKSTREKNLLICFDSPLKLLISPYST